MLARWLDWRDSSGKMDHGKVVPDLVLAVLLSLQVCVTVQTGRLPDFVWGVMDLSAAFGHASWRAFLRNKTATVQASVVAATETVTHVDAAKIVEDLTHLRGQIDDPDGGS